MGSAAIFGSPLEASPLTASETLGKQIYISGLSADGKPLPAYVGKDSTEFPGTSLPCVNCHGEDGHGRQEGGIKATDVTFEYLTLGYGHTHDSGRKHPAFDSDSIIRAVARGIDPAGNPLDSAMPRYGLSDRDKDNLIVYLKRLSTDFDPGLSDTTIRVGSVLPTQGGQAAIGQAMKNMLSAYIDELNGQGGIYNRKLQLVVAEAAGSQEKALDNARRLFEKERIFAIIAPFSGSQDRGIRLLAETLKIPVIGPYTLFPEENPVRSQCTFYLLPGLNNESRAMVDYLADVLNIRNAHAMVINPQNSDLDSAAEALIAQGRLRDIEHIDHITYLEGRLEPSHLAKKLETQLPDVIFFLGFDADLRRLQTVLSALKQKPYLFVSGSLTASKGAIDENYRNNIFLTFPALSSNQNQEDEFSRLIKQNNLSTEHLMPQALSYSAAGLLTEGLKIIGRNVSRKKLIGAIEKIYQFDSALMPLQSFGPNDHMGSTEVDIVSARLLKHPD